LLGILSGGNEMDTPASVTLQHRLVVRESTAAPRRRVQLRAKSAS
jgi:hypothetical protein